VAEDVAKCPVPDVEVGQVTDQNPIINKPYTEPARHWHFGDGAPVVRDGRRVAGYIPPMVKGGQLQITDELVTLEQVNRIRDRVREWREGGYSGATQVTKTVFNHWFDEEREQRPFFAQREAIETIAWLTEASADKRVGITITQYEAYERWAIKLATGAGKTLVMAMTITWSGLNKIINRQDRRFADAFLVVAPNLTVKGRLTGDDGLLPSDPGSAYSRFDLIPGQYAGMLGQLKVQVINWHQLAPKEDPRRSVLRRGRESDSAFARRVLFDLGPKKRVMVINDEAHHAWRPPPGLKVQSAEKDEVLEATVWINGLERVHRDREILRCIDFSATPMYPGAVGGEKAWRPFEWVVSDFGLVDAIESGLVKVPRIPTDDDAGASIPKYRNLWEFVKQALPKRGDDSDDAGHPLISYLSEVDGPLKQLAGAWYATYLAWTHTGGRTIPPVMIVVCNETKMAEMLEKHIAERGEASPFLVNHAGEQVTVRIDSKLLDDAEARDEGESAQDAAERLRTLVATVGKPGQPGEQVRCLISVGMLSEGWDARNVTQILGLRAFQSQLLCEQVVGRGLRRSDYGDLSVPEFVDVYGVPFQLLPFARASGEILPPSQTTVVRSLREREHLRIEFPRVEQIISDLGDVVTVDMDAIEPILVSPENDPNATWVEFEIGSPGKGIGGETQDRQTAYESFRMQRLVFRLAADLVTDIDKRDQPWVFPQMARIVRDVIAEKVRYAPAVKDERELCNLRYVAELRNRILACLRSEERDGLLPVLNQYDPIGDTTVNFQTAKPCEATTKSHISHVVYDSKLELQMARALEQDDRVVAYAKNERVFFEIPYRWQGTTGRYRPDFLIRLTSGTTLVVEGKGRKTERDDAKLTAARRWIDAVNQWGKLGHWELGLCFSEAELRALIAKMPELASVA